MLANFVNVPAFMIRIGVRTSPLFDDNTVKFDRFHANQFEDTQNDFRDFITFFAVLT